MARLRELREVDAERVAELFVEAFGDARRLDAREIRSWLDSTTLKPEWLRVLEDDGRVTGYGDIVVEGGELALDVAAPGRWDAFFDWAEGEARERDLRRVRVYVPADHELAAVASARGYRVWRSSYTMEIAVHEPPPVVAFPPGIDVRGYDGEAAAALRGAIDEAFAEDPFHHAVSEQSFRDFYLGARGFDPALWLLAWESGELAGFSLAYAERVGEPGLGWVGTLGVRAPWRRRGLGEALLRAAFRELYGRGLRRVGLGVDAENVTGALRLYERVGMRVIRRADNWVLDL
jgi:ribosomal protein S18 acetylase RimI-like enzyme